MRRIRRIMLHCTMFGVGKIVTLYEARIIEMGELRVVYGFADLDRYRIPVGVDNDLARPDPEDRITGNTAGRKDLRLFVAASMRPADSCGVMECGIDVDTAWMVQLMHIPHLPKGAVRQTLESSEIREPVQIGCGYIPLSSDRQFRTSG